jgi:predicted transcriptional regulator
MTRSKLEMHVDTLKVLAQRGPLQKTDIMYQANLNCNVLKENLFSLIKQGLVEEIVVGKNSVVYANTNRGSAVVRFFGELDKAFPVKEEEGKFLPVSY